MSNSLHPPTDDVLSLENPIQALQSSPEFRGPVEPLDGNHCNDHFALLYEDKAEQFAAAVPFVRQGLERGERCMYVVAENSRAAVREAMIEAGIDVDAALDSGALTFETVDETYLSDGEFDADEMMAFYADAVEEATEGFEAFRLAAEMSWILDGDVTTEECMAYESKINDLFDDTDAIALCQYDTTAFPSETICDVVRVHPHLIYDNTVCHNFYYIPPEEFCGPEQSSHEIERMLGTLLERTEAKTELRERKAFLEDQSEITSDPDRSFEAKLQALFELGCERFDLELGAIARVDPEADRFEIEYTSADHDYFEPGVALPLSETYCDAATEDGGVASVTDPAAAGYENITVHRNFGFRTYLGTAVDIEGGDDRTFFFVSSEPRSKPFSDDEHTFQQLMGQWVKYELEQRRRERDLERTIDRLETSNERLERFAYAASHDLQEPLRMVSTYLQLIERRADDELSAESREFLEFAVDGADRMREMIDGLLKYSRVETGGEPLEPVSLDRVLEDVLDDLQFRIEESDAEVEIGGLPRVQGDSSQLRQVFQNLLSNAIEYSGDEPPWIRISAELEDETSIVTVRDRGIGIDPEDAEQVFEVFERLHTREEHEGTGIGLALCQRIVERHGGEIWVESELGAGSTFSVALPTAPDR
ncbi:GHKL domain-containing protein [Natronorubrum sp. JWXQ-INN-674]|uniref:histidine kinase n=1 Tax=Natronorubrum halalkaliphilum TaxID=2691917 RepID=A0A6B0VPG7_9EURY|nr:MEDS domain-containing protein [Natronorubrum halalkaliphilum]MXV63378.1 GHKL domain-containing protein [Natronorubrum halalkaliphilum]